MTANAEIFNRCFEQSLVTKQKCIDNGFDDLLFMGMSIVESINTGGKLMLCGNGGSAADAQHLAAELLIRLRPHVNRNPLPAISLLQDTSTITACANDYSFDVLFERNLLALGRKNDCLLGLSTSGNSENVRLALRKAQEMGIHSFAFLGGDGGRCLNVTDRAFIVPSFNTASIQEAHIVAGHALMEFVEECFINVDV